MGVEKGEKRDGGRVDRKRMRIEIGGEKNRGRWKERNLKERCWKKEGLYEGGGEGDEQKENRERKGGGDAETEYRKKKRGMRLEEMKTEENGRKEI